jgi:phosphohistidine phosphatase
MALYLVQHGKSLPKAQDPERGLSKQGIANVKCIAYEAREHDLVISRIQHSDKKRAIQTAEIIANALNPQNGMQQISGINPLDDVSIFATQISNRDNIMIVGHLPFLEKLTSYLIMGAIDKLVLKFQNGGIVCLDQENGAWFIKWTLMPKIG